MERFANESGHNDICNNCICGFASGVVAAGGAGARAVLSSAAARSVLGEAAITAVLGTGFEGSVVVGQTVAGRVIVFGAESALEGAAFGAAQFELNGLISGYEYERFSGDYGKESATVFSPWERSKVLEWVSVN
jgi:hypothetical protein